MPPVIPMNYRPANIEPAYTRLIELYHAAAVEPKTGPKVPNPIAGTAAATSPTTVVPPTARANIVVAMGC